MKVFNLKASLETLFFHGIFIFSKENELFFLGKMKFPLENVVSKEALIILSATGPHVPKDIFSPFFHSKL
jgi:hypothetical protein